MSKYMLQNDQGGQTLVEVNLYGNDRCLGISIEGHNDVCTSNGFYSNIMGIVFVDGVATLYVYADINSEDPTHVIPLSGALESRRTKEP